jgi:hypothetical protein
MQSIHRGNNKLQPGIYRKPTYTDTTVHSTSYRQLQILQSKCLRVIGNYPRIIPITQLHTALNLEPIQSLSTVWRINFSVAVQLTLILLFAK